MKRLILFAPVLALAASAALAQPGPGYGYGYGPGMMGGGYGYGPAYVGPPVSLDFSYREYRGDRGWHGHHRGRGRWR